MENNNPSNQLTGEERQALLVEYDTCQSHNNGLGNQSWISISILITVNLLLLGQVIYEIVLKSDPVKSNTNLVLVTLIGLAMILILCIFKRWDKRVDFQIRLNHERMREIEEALGYVLWKNWRVHGLDLYYSDKEEEKARLKKRPKLQKMIEALSQRYPKVCWWEKLLFWKKKTKDAEFQMNYAFPTTGGFLKFNRFFPLLIFLWGIVIMMEFLIHYCPCVQNCLLN